MLITLSYLYLFIVDYYNYNNKNNINKAKINTIYIHLREPLVS